MSVQSSRSMWRPYVAAVFERGVIIFHRRRTSRLTSIVQLVQRGVGNKGYLKGGARKLLLTYPVRGSDTHGVAFTLDINDAIACRITRTVAELALLQLYS